LDEAIEHYDKTEDLGKMEALGYDENDLPNMGELFNHSESTLQTVFRFLHSDKVASL
jgi:hypothetical protein